MLRRAERVRIVVLVDNRRKRSDLATRWGLSLYVEVDGERILFDCGPDPAALRENAIRLGVDLSSVSAVVISHGHGDHTGAMTNVLKAMAVWPPKSRAWDKGTPMDVMRRYAAGRRVPLVAHPAAFRELWGIDDDGTKHGPTLGPPRAEWEASGAEVVLSEGPYQLGPGCWTTGFVPRESFERSGIPAKLYYRDGDTFVRHLTEDDQAIVINVADKGLVVVSGCAHAGIVNTVRRAQAISGVAAVWAVIGGFHLARASAGDVQRTIDAIKACHPQLITPTHCTGFDAINRFSEQMPEAFVRGLVGTTYLF